MQLILASASIGREFLLKGLKIPYQVIPSQIDEEKIMGGNPIETIKMRARLKGENVATKIIQLSNSQINKLSNRNKSFLILSADTEVIINNQLLGKPKDYKSAVAMLKMLSGKTHEVISGYYLIRFRAGDADQKQKAIKTLRQRTIQDRYCGSSILDRWKTPPMVKETEIYHGYDRSRVTFRRLTNNDIKLYLSITEYTRFTGSYALIASPQNFITKIEGSISNVIGLPLEKVIPIFRTHGIL